MTERPNKKALADALDLYRDSMRPFIVRRLKRVLGRKVDDCIRTALRDGQYQQFVQNLSDGRSVEAAIDINDFPQIVKRHWHDAFSDGFQPSSGARDSLKRIAEARNRVYHPEEQDLENGYAGDRLNDIAGVLAEINEPEQVQAVKEIRDGLMPFTTPAHWFQQGGRDVYAFAMDLETLDKLLPHRVDDRVVKDANRPLTTSHAKNIQKYLEGPNNWLLGTLLLGIPPDGLMFQPYEEEPGPHYAVGELRIRRDSVSSMKMFDGQHRRRAIRDALKEVGNSEKASSLMKSSLPVMIYVEDSIEGLQQMFADAAKTKPIERNTITRFDRRDAFNLAALQVAEESELFRGRVEMERVSVPRSSHCIIAINQLAMTLKTIELGFSGRVSKDRNDSYMRDLDSLAIQCLEWADDFMPAARDEYSGLMAGEIDNSDIPQERAKTMAFNATVIRILAGCYREWTKDAKDWKPLARFLRSHSLEPRQNGGLLVDAGAVAPGDTSPVAQRQLLKNAIDYIVRRAKEESD